MNKDQVTGMIDELAGSVKRKAGELTDNPKLQAKGMVQQVKGKVEGAWGKAKESAHNATACSDAHVDARVKLGMNGPTADAGCNKKN
ncbi:MAG: CsbD family protein [Terracidiphilus sp.]